MGATQPTKQRSRRSFLALVADFGVYGFALSFVSSVTILPAFVARLSESNLLIGLLTTVAVLGFNVPQIFITHYVEKMRTRKKFIMLYTLGERIPWLFLALFIVLMPGSGSSTLLFMFFLTYAVVNTSAGVTATPWYDLVAKVVPEGKRGLYFGTGNFIATVLSVVGGAAAGLLIDTLAFPLGYAACFFAAFLLTMISYIALWTVEEPKSTVNNEERNLSQYLQSLPDVLRSDSVFTKFLLATVVAGITTMGPAFLTAHALKAVESGEEVLGIYTAVYFASQVLSNFIWAHLGDTRGHVSVIAVGGLLGALSSMVTIFSNSVIGFCVAFALIGAYTSGLMVSWAPAIMELASEESRPTYLALAGVLRAFPASLAPLLGGVIADVAGSAWIFTIAAIAHLASVAIVIPMLRSPKKTEKTAVAVLELGPRGTILMSETTNRRDERP
jgi:MFS family permease